MAINFDNKYCKIVSSTNNFVNNTTEIKMELYETKETREREKLLKDTMHQVCERIQKHLKQKVDIVLEAATQIQSIETIANREQFLKDNPKIKAMVEEQEEMQQEGLFVMDKMMKENIDIDKLKYKETWQNLGLTDELCRKIDFIGTMSIGVEGIRESNLATLYDATKEKIVSPVADC